MKPTIHSLLTRGRDALATALGLDVDTARIEIQCLLQHVLDVQRVHLLSHPAQELHESQINSYYALLQRRLAGEPIAYLLGQREFFGLNFKVTPATLIPRPETELLVELALARIPSPAQTIWGRGYAFRVLDLGTGCGAIALAIANARPDVGMTAVDASRMALEVARTNAQKLHTHNVCLKYGDWFSACDGNSFDLIVSNPPYVAEGDLHLLRGDVRFEPLKALASGQDGLDDIRCIIQHAPRHLATPGWLLLEHGYDQAEQVRDLLLNSGFRDVFSEKDLAGIERVSGGQIGA
ncbi:MAG: peptide chain release factor N(5)-glutamine methyltransferase [Pseudomonadota bacterium]